ncbi:AcrB/AcrD/AcrF family protein [Sphingomonas lutea]|uniref:AcrB/AcrD/AcrF family protein n=1 Tax=Sphingomonas lutea TaxID=1045317 RepID=A0A7G9SI87_9SPHN|nr:AcrB/AcrD/AcrF family protein [Sphingomonas lutea]QNN67562.1 AcrB/AcrD/AcrF family protein [Sphingomonas lutea]
MAQRKDETLEQRAVGLLERHWKLLVIIVWLGFAAWSVYSKWPDIRFFNLADTDDNMRMMQVRGLLAGQDWYDLRQYRMNVPAGLDMHWSRLVDLPLAGLILFLKPLLGGATAERAAVAIAPFLPFLVMLFALALTARRLISPRAYLLVFLALFFAGSTNGMFRPTRIDHHGWQLAFLAIAVAGIADPRKVRGGLTLGFATAASLAIGLELLIYLAIGGVAMTLFWVQERDEAERLRAYAVALGGGTAAAFLLFASNANWQAVCDALSPVWLANALVGSALLFGLAWISPSDWKHRLALGVGAGLIIAAFHAFMWPHCLQRLEGVSPEVEQLWLSHVREARPVWAHGWRVAPLIVALPITGIVGWGVLVWLRRNDPEALRRTLAASAPGLVAALLLMWQTRTGPAAQMLATIGAAALLWWVVPKVWNATRGIVRVLAVTAVVLICAGAAVPFLMEQLPPKPQTNRTIAIGKANRLCNSLWGLRAVGLQPKGMVFTFVDLGPRLINVTHHDAVTGPYHRNGEQIGDVMNAFRGNADQARRIMRKYGADYLLTCPNSSTTTIFMSETPKGFYGQLSRGQVPGWLQPVQLPAGSPYRMWRVID